MWQAAAAAGSPRLQPQDRRDAVGRCAVIVAIAIVAIIVVVIVANAIVVVMFPSRARCSELSMTCARAKQSI